MTFPMSDIESGDGVASAKRSLDIVDHEVDSTDVVDRDAKRAKPDRSQGDEYGLDLSDEELESGAASVAADARPAPVAVNGDVEGTSGGHPSEASVHLDATVPQTARQLSGEGPAPGASLASAGASEPEDVSDVHDDDMKEEPEDAAERMRDAQLKYGEKVLMAVMRHKDCIYFKEPVDPVKLNIPDYFTIIKNPMDFGTVKSKFQAGEYSSSDELYADMKLVFYNCRLYNKPETDIVKMCNNVERVFKKHVDQMPKGDSLLTWLEHQEATATPAPKRGKKPGRTPGSTLRKAPPARSRSMSPALNGTPGQDGFVVPPPPATVSRTKSMPAVAPSPLGTVRTAADALAGRRASVGGIELDLQVNLHERLLENRPKREIKRVESLSIEPEPLKRQGSRGKMGAQLKYCLGIVKDFLNSKKLHPLALYFYVPFDYVKFNCLDYPDIIKRPIDLTTIRNKTMNMEYDTASDFADDMRLMFSNCFRYNPPGDMVHEAGKKLQAEFERRFALLPDEPEPEPEPEPVRHMTRVHDDEEDDDSDDEEEDDSDEDGDSDEDSSDDGGSVDAKNIAQLMKEIQKLQSTVFSLTKKSLNKKGKSKDKEGKKKGKKKSAKNTASRRASTMSTASARSVGRPRKQTQHYAPPIPPPPRPNAPRRSLPASRTSSVERLTPPAPVEVDSRPMTFEEKRALSEMINDLPPAKIPRLVQIIQDRIPSLRDAPAEELEIDIDSLDPTTLRELERYVQSVVKKPAPVPAQLQPQKAAPKLKRGPKDATAAGPSASSADLLQERRRKASMSSSSSDSSSSGSDSSDSDSSSDDDTAKPILGARSRTQSPSRRDPEPDSLLTLAPSAPATAPKPAAPAAPPAQAAKVDVKLPSTQTVVKEVKVDNLSAWGNLASGSSGAEKASQPASPAPDKVNSPGPGDSTFAEFKRKALEQQQKEQQARERREQEQKEAELKRQQEAARKEEERQKQAASAPAATEPERPRESDLQKRREEERLRRQQQQNMAQDAFGSDM